MRRLWHLPTTQWYLPLQHSQAAHLWTLELKRRVVCAVSVLRQAMNEMLADEGTRLR